MNLLQMGAMRCSNVHNQWCGCGKGTNKGGWNCKAWSNWGSIDTEVIRKKDYNGAWVPTKEGWEVQVIDKGRSGQEGTTAALKRRNHMRARQG
jgi:hypothetical protein